MNADLRKLCETIVKHAETLNGCRWCSAPMVVSSCSSGNPRWFHADHCIVPLARKILKEDTEQTCATCAREESHPCLSCNRNDFLFDNWKAKKGDKA